MSFSITNPLYPKPTVSMVNGTSTQAAGQYLTVTSTATVQFSAFNTLTTCIVLDIQGANTYCTFDGSTPSSTNGHILYPGSAYTWSTATATFAKFVATTTTNCTIYASQFTI